MMMSLFVDEIIEDIRNNKNNWIRCLGTLGHLNGIESGEIIIYSYGNSAILSTINVRINGVDIPTSYADRYKLEKTVKWWYKNISLNQALNND